MQSCPDTVHPSSLTPPVRALFEEQQSALETLRAELASLADRNRRLEHLVRELRLEVEAALVVEHAVEHERCVAVGALSVLGVDADGPVGATDPPAEDSGFASSGSVPNASGHRVFTGWRRFTTSGSAS